MNTRLLKKWRNDAIKLFNENISVKSDARGLYIAIPYLVKKCDKSFDIRRTVWTIYRDSLKDNYAVLKVIEIKKYFDECYKDIIHDYMNFMLNKEKKKHPYKGFKIKFFSVKRH